MKISLCILSLTGLFSAIIAHAQTASIDVLQAKAHVRIFSEACLKTGPRFSEAGKVFEANGLSEQASETWVSKGGIGAGSIIRRGDRIACMVSAIAEDQAPFVRELSMALDQLFPGDWQLGSAQGKPVVRIKTPAGFLFAQILPSSKRRVTMIAEY